MPRSAANVLDSYLSKPLWWRRGRAPTLKAMMRWFRPSRWKRGLRTDSFITWQRIEEQRAKYIARIGRLERLDRLLMLGLLPEIVEDQTLNPQIALVETPIQPNATLRVVVRKSCAGRQGLPPGDPSLACRSM